MPSFKTCGFRCTLNLTLSTRNCSVWWTISNVRYSMHIQVWRIKQLVLYLESSDILLFLFLFPVKWGLPFETSSIQEMTLNNSSNMKMKQHKCVGYAKSKLLEKDQSRKESCISFRACTNFIVWNQYKQHCKTQNWNKEQQYIHSHWGITNNRLKVNQETNEKESTWLETGWHQVKNKSCSIWWR